MLLTREVMYRTKRIPVDKLSRNSSKKLLVKCPKCGETRKVFAKAYFREETGLCHKCALKDRATSIPAGIVFGQWTVIGEGKQKGKSLCRCNCGNWREVTNSTLRSGKSTSCGCFLSSAKQAQRKYLEVGSKHARLTVISHSSRAGHSICTCECGNQAEVANWSLEHGKTRSCGCLQKEKAAASARKLVRTGENHHNWKGGISSEYERIRATRRFKDFLKTVRDRDNYQCRKCGISKNRMHAHHIKPIRFYPELICDPDNAVLLCPKCHRGFHKIYGRNATEENLNEFLSRERYKIRGGIS